MRVWFKNPIKSSLPRGLRGELLDQGANSLADLGIESAVEKASQRAQAGFWKTQCVVASVQTLQRQRLLAWPKRHFALIVTDEAHHATAASYRAVYDHLEPAWHLGVTATPDRFGKNHLGSVFESLAYEYRLDEAITSGWLAKIRTTAGDLNSADIEDAIRPHIEELANATRQEIGNRRTIVFTPDCGSAEAFASALTSMGIAARSISGDTPDRDQVLADFRHGAFRVLVNCNILTEGYDAPFIQAVVLARPTKSGALYRQMVGRGTRLALNKQDCLIVDFAWLTGRHQLVSPVDLFQATTKQAADDPEVQRRVKEQLSQGEIDLMNAFERAETEVRTERRVLSIKARQREARYGRVEYDPFGTLTLFGISTAPEMARYARKRPTEKQLAILVKNGIPHPDQMSLKRASQVIDVIFDRQRKGLATIKQVNCLIRAGFDPAEANSMPFAAASQHIGHIIAANLGRA